jgi:hypothetical protein
MAKYFIAEHNCAIMDVQVHVCAGSFEDASYSAHFVRARWYQGEMLTSDELKWLNHKYYWLAEEIAHEQMAI